jgi:hypothetical protein
MSRRKALQMKSRVLGIFRVLPETLGESISVSEMRRPGAIFAEAIGREGASEAQRIFRRGTGSPAIRGGGSQPTVRQSPELRQALLRAKGIHVSQRTVGQVVAPWRKETRHRHRANTRFENPPGLEAPPLCPAQFVRRPPSGAERKSVASGR